MDMTYETERLILRILHAEDADKVLQFYLDNKEIFEKYEPKRPANFYTTAYQRATLMCEYNLAVKLSLVRFYVFEKSQPDTIIGTVCFRNITRSIYQSCEVGYKLGEVYWHKGYAREALCMGIAVMFGEQKLHRIVANVMPDNAPSIRLLESLGFLPEGRAHAFAFIQGHWCDHLRFSLIAPDTPL